MEPFKLNTAKMATKSDILPKVREIFYSAQDEIVISKLCEKMLKIKEEAVETEFFNVFVHHVHKSIIYYKSEPAVERVMDFIANFATYSTRMKNKEKMKRQNQSDGSFLNSHDSLDESECEMIEPFLVNCFSLFINLHNAREKGVRLRCCQVVNKMLNLLGDEDSIDSDLSDAIYECMMIRIKDIYPPIRVQAVLALYRLQDPSDEECPIIDAYLSSLQRDTNHLVRKAILSKLAISRKTLPYLVERVRDVSDVNRKAAYNLLAEKVSIRALSIAQRIKLLTEGLKSNHSDKVRKSCTQMLKAWFRSCNHNFIKLFESLDVESERECSELAVEALLKDATYEKLQLEYIKQLEEFAAKSDGHLKLIDHSLLTSEKVFLWYSLCNYLKKSGDSDRELLLHDLLPELTGFCECIRQYAEKNFIDSAILTAFEGAEQSEFILEYLLKIAGLLDMSDEIGRKNLRTLVHDLLVLESVPISLINVLVKRFKDVETDEESFVQGIVETISDIKHPLVQVLSTAMKEKSRTVELQLARINVDMHECNDDLECAIKQQDYQQAALLKDNISELEKQKIDLQEMLEECQEQITKRVVREEDPETTLKCLTVGTAMLSELVKRGLSSTLMALKDELFFDGVKNEDPVIRNEAVKGLGILSYLKKEFAAQHLVFFLQVVQVDHEFVQLTAIKIIFDLFLLYGLTTFNQNTEDKSKTKETLEENTETNDATEVGDGNNEENSDKQLDVDAAATEDENQETTAAAENVLSVLLMFLQNESSDLRSVVAEGMAKVMITGRVASANVLSRLILVWYNPVTENDIKLRHCLATFLPAYAFQSRENQELFNGAFLPTLRTITNAPTTSPLSQIAVNNVINLFVQLTDVRNLGKYSGSSYVSRDATVENDYDSYVHDSIAMKICNEVLKDPEDPDIRLFCKALCQLTLCPRNKIVLSDLIELAMQMIDKLANNRLAKNTIEKFLQQVQEISVREDKENQGEVNTNAMETQDGQDSEPSINPVENIDERDDDIFAKPETTTTTFTPSGVLKNPLATSLKSRSVRSSRNVSFASPPHKMPRLSTSSIDFQMH